jgi:lipopolysaccharide export system protein LptA
MIRPAALVCVLALAAGPALAQKGGTALLPGGNSHAPISVNAEKLEYFSKDGKAVYSGNVVAKQGDATLRAATLSIFFSHDKTKQSDPGMPNTSGSQVERMEAQGPVTITQKDQVGTGDRGLYEKAENKVYLIGNVKLSQGPNIAKGEKLVYDLTTGQAQIIGRVSSLFVPGSNEDAKPKKAEQRKPAERRR